MKEIGIDHCLKSFNRIVTNASTISKKKQNLPPTIMMMMNSPEGSKKEGGEEGKELNRMTSISKMAKNRMMMNLHGGGGGGGKSNQNLLNPLFFSASNKNMKSLISNDPNQMFGQIDIRVEDPFKDSFLKKEELNDLKLLSSILIKLNQLSFLSDYKEKRSKFLLQFTEFLKHRIFFFFMKNIIFTFLNIIIIKKKKKEMERSEEKKKVEELKKMIEKLIERMEYERKISMRIIEGEEREEETIEGVFLPTIKNFFGYIKEKMKSEKNLYEGNEKMNSLFFLIEIHQFLSFKESHFLKLFSLKKNLSENLEKEFFSLLSSFHKKSHSLFNRFHDYVDKDNNKITSDCDVHNLTLNSISYLRFLSFFFSLLFFLFFFLYFIYLFFVYLFFLNFLLFLFLLFIYFYTFFLFFLFIYFYFYTFFLFFFTHFLFR